MQADPELDWEAPDELLRAALSAVDNSSAPSSADDEANKPARRVDPRIFSFPDSHARLARRTVAFWREAIPGSGSDGTNSIILDALAAVRDGIAALTPSRAVRKRLSKQPAPQRTKARTQVH